MLLILQPLHLNAPWFHRYIPPGAFYLPIPITPNALCLLPFLPPLCGLHLNVASQKVAAHFLLWPLLIWEVRRVDVPTLQGGKLECVFQSLLRDPTTCHFYILRGLKQTSAGRLILLPSDRAGLTVSLCLHAKLSKQMFIKETWGWCRSSRLPFSKRANKGIFPKW